MKFETTLTITKRVEIDLPFFAKKGEESIAVLSDKEMIAVTFSEYETQLPSVFIATRSINNSVFSWEKITAKEFEDAFTKASDYLSERFESMRDMVRDAQAGDIADDLVNTIKSVKP